MWNTGDRILYLKLPLLPRSATGGLVITLTQTKINPHALTASQNSSSKLSVKLHHYKYLYRFEFLCTECKPRILLQSRVYWGRNHLYHTLLFLYTLYVMLLTAIIFRTHLTIFCQVYMSFWYCGPHLIGCSAPVPRHMHFAAGMYHKRGKFPCFKFVSKILAQKNFYTIELGATMCYSFFSLFRGGKDKDKTKEKKKNKTHHDRTRKPTSDKSKNIIITARTKGGT